MLRNNECDVQRRCGLAIDRLGVGDGTGAVTVEPLRSRERLRQGGWPTQADRSAAGERPIVIGSRGTEYSCGRQWCIRSR